MGPQRVRHDWVTNTNTFSLMQPDNFGKNMHTALSTVFQKGAYSQRRCRDWKELRETHCYGWRWLGWVCGMSTGFAGLGTVLLPSSKSTLVFLWGWYFLTLLPFVLSSADPTSSSSSNKPALLPLATGLWTCVQIWTHDPSGSGLTNPEGFFF